MNYITKLSIMLLYILTISCDMRPEQQKFRQSGGLDFKHVASYIYKGFRDSTREDYVYVFNYWYKDSIEKDYQEFIDNTIKIDYTKLHRIYFLKYDESLPDSGGYNKNNDLMDGKFSRYIVFEFSYMPNGNIKQYLFWHNSVVEKVIHVK